MNRTKVPMCKECRKPLLEFGFPEYIVYACDNVHCRLYRERQEMRTRGKPEGESYRQRRQSRIFMAATGGDRRFKEMSPERCAAMDRRKARPGYQGWLKTKNENYHILRDLGYTCAGAIANSSKKRMRELGYA